MFINYNSKNWWVYYEDDVYWGRYLMYPIYWDEIRPAWANDCYFKNWWHREVKLNNEKEVLQSIKDFFKYNTALCLQHWYPDEAEQYKQKILLLPNHK